MLNIGKFQEYLDNSRKLIMRNEKFKFWHLQNFMKIKSYQPKTFFNRTPFLMEHAGLSKQLFG